MQMVPPTTLSLWVLEFLLLILAAFNAIGNCVKSFVLKLTQRLILLKAA